MSGCARLQKSHSAIQAEALGFLHVLQVIWAQGFRCVWFEGDNLELVNLINKNGDRLDLGTLLYDIRTLTVKLPQASINHTNREKNAAADVLSRYASTMSSMYQTFTILERGFSFRSRS